jgi:hypothetical protein
LIKIDKMSKEVEDVYWKWLNEEKIYKVYRVGKIYSTFNNGFLNPYFNTNKKWYASRTNTKPC